MIFIGIPVTVLALRSGITTARCNSSELLLSTSIFFTSPSREMVSRSVISPSAYLFSSWFCCWNIANQLSNCRLYSFLSFRCFFLLFHCLLLIGSDGLFLRLDRGLSLFFLFYNWFCCFFSKLFFYDFCFFNGLRGGLFSNDFFYCLILNKLPLNRLFDVFF